MRERDRNRPHRRPGTRGVVVTIRGGSSSKEAKPPQNELEVFIRKTRAKEVEVMAWLFQTHPDLVRGAVLAREVTIENAGRCVEVIRAYLRSRPRT